ncbi:MAG TPA: translation elongation factor Ts, partial [Verrucomicrobiae bacterium]|nr:translation elongation factor Ts [Verrucomicrobiae bacterium]
GAAKAVKKAGRTAADGAIAVAASAEAVAIVEVNCETDFVAKGDEFQNFTKAAAAAALAAKAGNVEQLAAAKSGGQTLEEIRKTMVAKIGENITLRRAELVMSAGGPVSTYIHAGNRIGVVVALGKGDNELGKDIAMHVAAQRPQYLNAEQVPADAQAAERKIIEAQTAEQSAGKPPEIVKKMVEGKLRKYLSEITLLGQAFVKDPDQTVEKVLAARGGSVVRFVRFEVGEGIEKQATDFAAEVAAMTKKH